MRRLIARPAAVLSTLALLASTQVQAEFWDVRDGLARSSTARLALYVPDRNGNKVLVDTLQRQWLINLVDVADRLAKAYNIAPPPIWITDDSSANAFVRKVGDGRYVMVTNTGMLHMVESDADQLAAVIGHELGHLKGRHLENKQASQGAIKLLGFLAGLAVDLKQADRGVDTKGLGMQLGDLGSDLVNAKFSRDDEREADDLGIHAMAKAGFNPQAAPQLWRRMREDGGGGRGVWLDSHPSSEEREQTLAAVAATLGYTPRTMLASSQQSGQPVRISASRMIDVPRVNDPWPVSAHASIALTDEELAAETPSAYRRGLQAWLAGQAASAIAPLRHCSKRLTRMATNGPSTCWPRPTIRAKV